MSDDFFTKFNKMNETQNGIKMMADFTKDYYDTLISVGMDHDTAIKLTIEFQRATIESAMKTAMEQKKKEG